MSMFMGGGGGGGGGGVAVGVVVVVGAVRICARSGSVGWRRERLSRAAAKTADATSASAGSAILVHLSSYQVGGLPHAAMCCAAE